MRRGQFCQSEKKQTACVRAPNGLAHGTTPPAGKRSHRNRMPELSLPHLLLPAFGALPSGKAVLLPTHSYRGREWGGSPYPRELGRRKGLGPDLQGGVQVL